MSCVSGIEVAKEQDEEIRGTCCVGTSDRQVMGAVVMVELLGGESCARNLKRHDCQSSLPACFQGSEDCLITDGGKVTMAERGWHCRIDEL